jgi:tetratricopeptide (TPR) repeat protein
VRETVFSTDAEILTQQGKWPALEALASRWVRADAGSGEAWLALSRAAFELGRFSAALEAFQKVLNCSGGTAENLTTLGRLALHALEFDTATSALAEAEALAPDAPEMLAARGLLLTYLGRFAEAETYCRRCLACSPEFVPAYTTLSRLTNGRFSDHEMNVLSRLAANRGTHLDHRIAAAFALAHGHYAREEPGVTFRAYKDAHRLSEERNRREGRHYDQVRTAQRMERLMELFPGTEFETPGHSKLQRTPIFIVGMPRSGTTLIESVLSAHSRVRAGGERPQMQQLLDAYIGLSDARQLYRLDASLLQKWRAAYIADLGISGTAGYFTDKNLLNFEAAGLIARLFPTAIIIHVRRNPIETCFSIYRNEFSKFWTFTDRLEHIGHYYGQYARLVQHWERVLGRRFYTVQYEEFAGHFDAMAPALVAACGLEWEEQCRNFQSVRRAIPTFSAVQAREAVSVRSGAAEHYRPFLGALYEALERAQVDLVTGALCT